MTTREMRWFRTGADRRNSCRMDVEGPGKGEVVQRVTISQPSGEGSTRGAVVVDAEGRLLVLANQTITAVTLRGEVAWAVRVREPSGRDLRSWSPPIAMPDGHCAFTTREHLHVLDGDGHVAQQVDLGFQADDTGYSPNLTHEGELVLTGIMGEVVVVERGGAVRRVWEQGGCDIVPPVIYPDGSLGLCGYSSLGYRRVLPSGVALWASGVPDADLLPCLSERGVVAFGETNTGLSHLFDAEGTRLGTLAGEALFADAGQGRFVAVGREQVQLVDAGGAVLWRHDLPPDERKAWYRLPAIDGTATAFVADRGHVEALELETGRTRWSLALPGLTSGVTLLGDGLGAVVQGGDLLLVR